MRGQTSVYTVVSFDFSFTPLFYYICSASGLLLEFVLILKSLSSKYKVLIRYTRQEKCQCWLNCAFLHFEHLCVFGG